MENVCIQVKTVEEPAFAEGLHLPPAARAACNCAAPFPVPWRLPAAAAAERESKGKSCVFTRKVAAAADPDGARR